MKSVTEYETFVVYESFWRGIKKLKSKKDQQQVIFAMFAYGIDGEFTELDGNAGALWELIYPQIEAAKNNRKNGAKGGRPPQENNPPLENATKNEKPPFSQKVENAETNVNENENGNVDVNGNENENGNAQCEKCAQQVASVSVSPAESAAVSQKPRTATATATATAKLPRRFDEFWQPYPNKKNKTDAIKSWIKLKPDDELIDTIIAAVQAQKQHEGYGWQKENGKYIPHPTTWLNQQRWLDEPTETSNRPGGFAGLVWDDENKERERERAERTRLESPDIIEGEYTESTPQLEKEAEEEESLGAFVARTMNKAEVY